MSLLQKQPKNAKCNLYLLLFQNHTTCKNYKREFPTRTESTCRNIAEEAQQIFDIETPNYKCENAIPTFVLEESSSSAAFLFDVSKKMQTCTVNKLHYVHSQDHKLKAPHANCMGADRVHCVAVAASPCTSSSVSKDSVWESPS